MKASMTLVLAVSMALSVAAQNTTTSLLSICNAQHDACDVAPEANHAFCASQLFSCISPNDNCGCTTKSQACLENPPTGNLFDCATPLAACVVACSSPSSSVVVSPTSTVVAPIGTGASISGSPTTPSNGSIVTPTAPASTFAGSATKAGMSIAGVLAAGIALLL